MNTEVHKIDSPITLIALIYSKLNLSTDTTLEVLQYAGEDKTPVVWDLDRLKTMSIVDLITLVKGSEIHCKLTSPKP